MTNLGDNSHHQLELNVYALPSEDGRPWKILEHWWTDQLEDDLDREILKQNKLAVMNKSGCRPRIRSSEFCPRRGTIKIVANNEESKIFIANVVSSPTFCVKFKNRKGKSQTVRFGVSTGPECIVLVTSTKKLWKEDNTKFEIKKEGQSRPVTYSSAFKDFQVNSLQYIVFVKLSWTISNFRYRMLLNN